MEKTRAEAIATKFGYDFKAIITFKGIVGEYYHHIKWIERHFLTTANNMFISVDDISTIRIEEVENGYKNNG